MIWQYVAYGISHLDHVFDLHDHFYNITVLNSGSSAGRFKSRAFEAAFTFAFGGAIFLASHSVLNEPASAQMRSRIGSTRAVAPTAVTPDQHRVPTQQMPAQQAPMHQVQPMPVPPPTPSGMEPMRIDPSQRQEILQRHTGEMKREHCLRKLEARRRALVEQRAEQNNRAK
jgi:hypothetical protein